MSEPTKLMKLERVFHDMKNVAVSYSGGVDSTFLLAVAARVLGADHVMAITILSDITPPWDIGFATSFAGKTGVNHTVIEAHDKIDHPEFKVNSPKRCYHCKLYNHERIQAVLPEGYTLVSGTNASDTGGDRPGAIKAQHIIFVFNFHYVIEINDGFQRLTLGEVILEFSKSTIILRH